MLAPHSRCGADFAPTSSSCSGKGRSEFHLPLLFGFGTSYLLKKPQKTSPVKVWKLQKATENKDFFFELACTSDPWPILGQAKAEPGGTFYRRSQIYILKVILKS